VQLADINNGWAVLVLLLLLLMLVLANMSLQEPVR
jgi:hypothetical protein